MAMRITPWSENDVDAIRAFNARLGAHEGFVFPARADDLMTVGPPGSPLHHELFLARDGECVRGGYALKFETLLTPAAATPIANLQLPLTEGLVDKRYAALGAALPRDALQRNPHLYCLGMGNAERPLPQLLKRLRWRVDYVPFLFRVLRANAFLREIAFLRQRRAVALAADLARWSGAATLGLALHGTVTALRRPHFLSALRVERVAGFDARADALQARVRGLYGAFCERGSAALNQKFPADDPRLLRLYVSDDQGLIGWLVLSRNRLRGHKQFGNMHLGCLVDGLCAPDDADALIVIATRTLAAEGVDLIVSNQQHHAWVAALRGAGYLSGPSNFVLATSPALTALAPEPRLLHMNRGDGDGPINL